MAIKHVVLALALVGAGPAFAMDAETFYVKGVALKKKGVGALFSSDIKLLQNEMQSAGASVKAENAKAKASGKPLYCPPAQSKMNAEQALAEFGKIPQDRRKAMTVRQAWRDILIRKFPC
jgi:hypothetical protein